MSANLYLPGDDLIDQSLAEFLGYFWCRFNSGQVVGERIVRFLVSPEQFEQAKEQYGAGAIVPANNEEPVEQLAFKPLPPFHSSRDEMARIEAKLYQSGGLWQIYINHLRGGLGVSNTATAQGLWLMVTADAKTRSKAAFITVEAQRPKQQALFG